MEDIEDLLVGGGGGGGAPPGFRLPVAAAVGVKPRSKSRSSSLQDSLKSHTSNKIPGTQVSFRYSCDVNCARNFRIIFFFLVIFHFLAMIINSVV